MSAAEERLANDPTSELWGEHRSRYRFAAQFVGGKTVLDVACGAGFGLTMLSEAGANPIGVDYDAGSLSDIHRAQPRVGLTRADATQLPFNDGAFDVIATFETIEHVGDARAMVLELRRVLRRGGRLVLSTPNRLFGPPERHSANQFHIREFTADELRDLLSESFDEVQLFGQRPVLQYRYVPFLMVDPHYEPAALAWKALVRLPYGMRNAIALTVSGKPFYPGEDDYCFDAGATDRAHALLAVAR